MSKALKIGLAALVLIIGVGTLGVMRVKHNIQTTEYCAGCHVIAPYYDSWNSSAFLANTHKNAGLTCQNCHTRTVKDGIRELVSYATHSYDLPLKDHRVRPEDCEQCHGSYENLAEATKDLPGPNGVWLGRNPHDSHWGKIDCGICHKMHKPSVDLCADCHKFPATGPAWTALKPAQAPPGSLIASGTREPIKQQ